MKKELGPFDHPNHRKPMTRRDLLAQGFISYSASLTVPSLLGILCTRRAYGASCDVGTAAMTGGDTSSWAHFQLDRAGGPTISSMPLAADGSLLSAAALGTIGIAPNLVPANVDAVGDNLRIGSWIHRPEPVSFAAGMRSVLTADELAKVNVVAICNSSNDDNNQVPWGNIPRLLARATGSNTLAMITGAGNNAQSTGNYAVSPAVFDPSVTTANIRSAADAQAMVQAPAAVAALGSASVDSIIKRIGNLSESSFKRFSALSLPDQIREVMDCDNEKVRQQMTGFDPNALNPAADTAVTSIFAGNTATGALPSGLKAVLDGYTRSFSFTQGGCDYHGNARAATDQRDFDAGVIAGQAIKLALAKGRKLMITVVQDGAVSGTPGGNHQADNGARSQTLFMAVNPAGRPEFQTGQLGAYNAAGAVDNITAFSASPINVSALVALQALGLEGRATEAELIKVFGSNPFGADIGKFTATTKV